jgi:hypothetical protein
MKRLKQLVIDYWEPFVLGSILGGLAYWCAGCSTPNIERLSRQLSENNATFYLEVPSHRGVLRIGRANPTLGNNTSVSDHGGLTVTVPTNTTMSVQYLVPVNSTNNQQKVQKP